MGDWEENGTPNYAQAVSAGQWQGGDYYDTSFDGPSPGMWGESIGRSRYAKDTNRASDWAGDGGSDAAGQSPGQANHIDVFSVPRLIEHAHELVNASFFALGMNSTEILRFSIDSSQVGNIQLVDAPGLGYSVEALYSFSIEDLVSGQGPNLWVGTLRVDFIPAGARSFRLDTNGSLVEAASGDSFAISHQDLQTGFGTGIQQDQQVSSLTLQLGGNVYSLNVTSDIVRRLESDESRSSTMTRTQQDWGGPEIKSYSGFAWHDRVDATQVYETMSLGLPFPALPPALGSSSGYSQSAAIQISGLRTWDEPGAFRLQLDSYDVSLDGSLVAQLDPSSGLGTVALVRQSGVPGDPSGDFLFSENLPITYNYGGGPLLWSLDESAQAGLAGAKFVTSGTVSFSVDGYPFGAADYYIDPPCQVTFTPVPKPDNVTTVYGADGNGGGGIGGGPGLGSGRFWAGAATLGACIVGAALTAVEAPAVSVIIGGACGLGEFFISSW